MSKAREIEIAKENGWQRLGVFETPVQSKLTADEKVELGNEITETLSAISALEEQKKNYNDKIKGKIADCDEKLQALCDKFRSGVKTEDRSHPAFYDIKNDQRHYVDIETGEIIKTTPAGRDDAQMKIGA